MGAFHSVVKKARLRAGVVQELIVCGIAGILDASSTLTQAQLHDRTTSMSNALRHRGPDDEGIWLDFKSGIALGHRRLSILDLSPLGRQPMFSACGRFVIVFNGEIYNYEAIRRELEGERRIQWRGHSDTEVMLEAIATWGLEAAIVKFAGMFAFTLWDQERRTLWLARDRLGEKPLYYGWVRNMFVFASELKAFQTLPEFNAEIDKGALALYARYGYVPAPYTVYSDVYKLPPATWLRIGEREMRGRAQFSAAPAFAAGNWGPQQYWSLQEAVIAGSRNPFKGAVSEAQDQLEIHLRKSVQGCMIADVPIGALLSGGIDSSTVVALMQVQSNIPVQTFSIGFREKKYNEADFAALVAQRLGTHHTELYVTAAEAANVVPSLSTVFDEPFAAPSQIPTLLLSRMTRAKVTVALSGDGGDELFGGYNRHVLEFNRALNLTPRWLRKVAVASLRRIPSYALENVLSRAALLLPRRWRFLNPVDKFQKLIDVLEADNERERYRNLVSHWRDPREMLIEGIEHPTLVSQFCFDCKSIHPSHEIMCLDTLTYLPDEVLVKVDRASMATSLEVRAPFLDHRVVEFAWSLPLDFKIRNRTGKYLLRGLLSKYLPSNLINRPKSGFTVPVGDWLRGPLRPWAEELLQGQRLREHNVFQIDQIRDKWGQHVSGRRDWQHSLWNVLMLQSWLESHRKLCSGQRV